MLDPVAIEAYDKTVEVESVRWGDDFIQSPPVVHTESQNFAIMGQA